MDSRVCNKCGLPKPLDEFPRNKMKSLGRSHTCLMCSRIVNKLHHAAPAAKAAARNRRLQRLYDLSIEEFDKLLASQDGVCAICKLPEGGKVKGNNSGWHVDHDHNTGRVRGVLCPTCNNMLGYAKDNPATLQAGIEYLK